MSDEEPPAETADTPRGHPGEIGRRAALRRDELGLTREEVAARAEMAPEYLQYVEEHAASPSTSSLLRLAAALKTTMAELSGSQDRPPGTARAPLQPLNRELTPDECRLRLGAGGIGRVGVCTEDGPAVIPVNYTVVDGAVVFRTAPGTSVDRSAGERIAFEVDRLDEALSRGWSVLMTGRAHHVTEPAEVRELTELALSDPWAGGDRDLWVRITPDRLSGRLVGAR